MTNEQILELVKEYFEVNGIMDDGICSEYYGKPDAFLKFALLIHQDGYNKGYDEGYDSSTMSSKMNMWEEE